jgi:hypothetical protein
MTQTLAKKILSVRSKLACRLLSTYVSLSRIATLTTASKSPGPARHQNTGETGKNRIRYRVYTQTETDAGYLGRILEQAIDEAHLAEYFQKGYGSYFVLDFPEEYEAKFEMLLSFSCAVKSYHLQHVKE